MLRRFTDPYNQLVAVMLGLAVWSKPITDPDLGWHLFGGAWIARHGSMPTFDPINLFNPVWHNYHWLGQLVLYGLYSVGGYALLRFALGLVMAWIFLVVLDCCLIVSGSKRSSLLMSLCLVTTAVLLAPITSVRPQMVAILMVALAFRRLLEPQTKWELPYLALLTILLVNIHVYWVFIPFLWFLMRLLPAFISDAGCKGRSVIGALLLVACGGVSPYLGRSYVLIVDYILMPSGLQSTIRELQSIFSMDALVVAVFLSYLLIYARNGSLAQFRSKLSFNLLFLTAAALAMKNVKFIPFFALFSIPLILPLCGEALQKVAPSIFTREMKLTRVAQVLFLSIAVYVAARDYPTNLSPEGTLLKRFPIEVCREVAKDARKSNVSEPVRVLTHFNHGGWCRFAAFEQNPSLDLRVTTDGRTQEVPYDLYKRSFDLYNLQPGWRETLRIWDVNYVVLSEFHPLSQVLVFLPNWDVSFRDKNFTAFSSQS